MGITGAVKNSYRNTRTVSVYVPCVCCFIFWLAGIFCSIFYQAAVNKIGHTYIKVY